MYTAAAWRIGADGGDTKIIWLMAIAMRLVLLPLTPELSDDIYRYLWDGHVQLSGVNPYLFAPAAPELEELRTAYHGLVNNPTVPTIYPPFAQAAFLLIALMGSSILSAKIVWLVCDLATAWVLSRIARTTGRGEKRVLLLYLWAPLLLVEIAWSGHLESLGLLVLAIAILMAGAAQRGPQPARTGAMMLPRRTDAVGCRSPLAARWRCRPLPSLHRPPPCPPSCDDWGGKRWPASHLPD